MTYTALIRAARKLSVVLIVTYFYFYQIFEAVGLKFVGLGLMAGSLLINAATNLYRPHIHRPMRQLYPWMYFVLVLLFHNEYMRIGNYGTVLMPLAALSFVLLLNRDASWVDFTCRTIIRMGMIHVAATLLFALSNPLYLATMPKLWGYFPVGTSGGANGAAAGLTRHYSYNGIYCAVTLIFVASCVLSHTVSRRDRRRYIVMMFMAALAVLLTQKRAHLIFSIAALMLLYMLCGYHRGVKKWVKLCLAMGGMITAAGVIVLFVPSLSGTLERLLLVANGNGGADISTGRFAAWAVGMQLFRQSPVLGKGWFYFPLYYNRTEFPEIHNIYIQYLCELGIVGTVIMLCAMLGSFFAVLRELRRHRRELPDWMCRSLAISVGMQLFVLMYGLTGCCMTDITVISYLLSVGMGLSCVQHNRRLRRSAGLQA